MIETTNNIIFWIGYMAIFSILFAFAIAGFYDVFTKLMKTKWFFVQVFNRAYEKSLKDLSEEDFEEWYIGLKEKYEKLKNDQM